MSHEELIAAREKMNELKAKRRGVELQRDEASEVLQYCKERIPVLDELIEVCQRRIEDIKPSSPMTQSDSAWSLKRLREWTNTI